MTEWEKMEKSHITALKQAEEVLRFAAKNLKDPMMEWAPPYIILSIHKMARDWVARWCEEES